MSTPEEILSQYDRASLHDANEAETRLHVIDQILFSVLEWTHDDVAVEKRVSEDGSQSFADYKVSTGMTGLVLEAKRVGATFKEVPNVRRARLRGSIMEGETGEAIRQARDYARKLSIPFAVVTNGAQWIIFPATRTDEVKFEDSSAIIFPNLKSALQDEYSEFFDLLSRPAVISGSLENELLGRISDQLEERRLNRFYTSGATTSGRNPLFPLIEEAVTVAFSEDIVAEDPDLLKKCYVTTNERMRFDWRIRMHVSRRESAAPSKPKRPMKRQERKALVETLATAAKRLRPVAVLLLGSVGAGKTTFLWYTRRVSAEQMFVPKKDAPYPHWIYLDFRELAEGQSSSEFLFRRLRDYIDQEPYLSDYDRCIRHAYNDQIRALLNGPLRLLANDETERNRRISELLMKEYEEVSPYVERIIGYAAKHVPVFLIIDNIDQFEEEHFQERIFGEAMALARRLNVNLIVSLRDATYVRYKNLPIFDAFDFDPISIDPPSVKAVLGRRFFLARSLLEGQAGDFTAENGVRVRMTNLADSIDLVQRSVLGTEVGNLLEVIATSDIRLALRMTREFLQHGYTAPGKAIRIYRETGSYMLPRHEALRAIILGNRRIYHEEFSTVGNIFDSKLSLTSAQLLRLFVLAALVNYSSSAGFQYVNGEHIQKAVREIGFGDEIALKVLADLVNLRFIFTASHGEPSFEAAFIPSRLGGYIIRDLIGNFTYLENVMYDTFISATTTWNEIRDTSEQITSQRDTLKRLKLRIKRAKAFYGFIDASYTALRDESQRRGLSSEWLSHPLHEMQSRFQSNLNAALNSATALYARPAANSH